MSTFNNNTTTNMQNQFEIAHENRGTLSPAQENALRNFVINLGRKRFGEYRTKLGIHKPITRLSKRQAWRLIDAITNDLGGAQ